MGEPQELFLFLLKASADPSHLLGSQCDDVIADEDEEYVAGSSNDGARPPEVGREERLPVPGIRLGESRQEREDHEAHVEELEDCRPRGRKTARQVTITRYERVGGGG